MVKKDVGLSIYCLLQKFDVMTCQAFPFKNETLFVPVANPYHLIPQPWVCIFLYQGKTAWHDFALRLYRSKTLHLIHMPHNLSLAKLLRHIIW